MLSCFNSSENTTVRTRTNPHSLTHTPTHAFPSNHRYDRKHVNRHDSFRISTCSLQNRFVSAFAWLSTNRTITIIKGHNNDHGIYMHILLVDIFLFRKPYSDIGYGTFKPNSRLVGTYRRYKCHDTVFTACSVKYLQVERFW